MTLFHVLSITDMDTTKRASLWSITINNPSKEEVEGTLPPGWTLEGQYERGEEGTLHFQGLLKTTQVRFSAVKRQFPRGHIEIARNEQALRSYVHKEETRVAEFTAQQTPNIFQLQNAVAHAWKDEEYKVIRHRLADTHKKDAVLLYVDQLVDRMIIAGARGIEFVSVNPMWRSSWSRHAHAILQRYLHPPPPQTDRQTESMSWLAEEDAVDTPEEKEEE